MFERYVNFNPRVPCGTRHISNRYLLQNIVISIRGSRVGPDPLTKPPFIEYNISIRGSRVGPDVCREYDISYYYIFQSAGPVWDPTFCIVRNASGRIFQSAGPVWDPTTVRLPLLLYRSISIRGSRVGPDFGGSVVGRRDYISIRGSRVGPDRARALPERHLFIFQSAGPVWDPT